MNIDYFERICRQQRISLQAFNTTVDMIAFMVPHCQAIETNQEIVAPYLQVQLASGAQGACFMHRADLVLKDIEGIVGENALDAYAGASHIVKVALIDALFAHLHEGMPTANERLEFNGTYSEKSYRRAQAIARFAGVTRGKRVAIIGVVHDIVRSCIESGAEVMLADFGQTGSSMFGCEVTDNYQELIDWSDISIVTGNVLKTDTLAQVLTRSAGIASSLTIFAMTGANIAPAYLYHGADVVITEQFPYYWFAGTSSYMSVYRHV